MDVIKFISWCEIAVREIRYAPDRIAVQKELYAHMEDHYLDLLEQGVDEETARKQTVEAMGDAYEIAHDLAAVHPPFWGYFLRSTRILLAACFCLLLIVGMNHLPDLYIPEPQYWTEARSMEPRLPNCTLLQQTEPAESERSDGYRFSVPKASVWETTDGRRILTVQVVQWNPIPLVGRAEPVNWFRGQDSTGAEYDSHQETINTGGADSYISAFSYPVSPWKTVYRLEIWNFPEHADWFRLSYDRDGRNLSVHIPLTGGESQ